MPTCSLREHSARLTQDDGGWLLRYPIARHQYGSREVELVEVMIPLVAKNYADYLKASGETQDNVDRHILEVIQKFVTKHSETVG